MVGPLFIEESLNAEIVEKICWKIK